MARVIGRSDAVIYPMPPRAVMEFLFVQLMLWGRGQGFQMVQPGMAPLSGVDDHPLAPLWNR